MLKQLSEINITSISINNNQQRQLIQSIVFFAIYQTLHIPSEAKNTFLKYLA